MLLCYWHFRKTVIVVMCFNKVSRPFWFQCKMLTVYQNTVTHTYTMMVSVDQFCDGVLSVVCVCVCECNTCVVPAVSVF